MKTTQRRWPAEWEPTAVVLAAWPREDGDWAPYLDQVRPCMAGLVAALARHAAVLLLADKPAEVRCALEAVGADLGCIRIIEGVEYNDTWIRDYGPLAVVDSEGPLLLDFGFNGWGLKYAAAADNCVTRALYRAGHLGQIPLQTCGLILEGGSVESDGAGTVLTTSACLMSDNRNPHLNRAEIERALGEYLGARRVLWLEHGHLVGDDTDAHVDTLARLCPGGTIAYVGAAGADTTHRPGLEGLRRDLEGLRQEDGRPWRLVELPMAPEMHAPDDGRRLPTTYANFLFLNGTVLMPTYGDPFRDTAACNAMAQACPGWRIETVDCRALVLQHGSLHCSTMQIPAEVLPCTR